MKLEKIIKGITVNEIIGDASQEISGINMDSRLIEPGHIFVAVKGTQTDGHTYIQKAIEKGARTVVCENLPETLIENVTYIKVNDTEDVVGKLATTFYGVHIHRLRDPLDAAGACVLPYIVLVAEAQRIAVLGDPDVVLADVRKVQRVIEPAGIGVNARAVPRAADRLAEGDGAGRALGGAQGIGAPAADTLGVVVDAQRQTVAADQAQHHAGLLDGLGLVDGLTVEVNADAQARVDRALNVPTIGRILDQRTAAVAAVAAADDGKRDAVRLDGVPVNAALELRDINAAGRAVQCAVRRKGVDIALNNLLARDGLVGGRVIIIRCAVNILPAGVLVYRGGRAGHGKAVVGQLLHRNVIRPARRRVGHLGAIIYPEKECSEVYRVKNQRICKTPDSR